MFLDCKNEIEFRKNLQTFFGRSQNLIKDIQIACYTGIQRQGY